MDESTRQAIDAARPGGPDPLRRRAVWQEALPRWRMFNRNVTLAGGIAPDRAYLPQLVADVLTGDIEPGQVFDRELPPERVADGYAAMDKRRAIKVLLRR
jgi:threonine dehydrogenase-like Zn-dependent dehydrogenase